MIKKQKTNSYFVTICRSKNKIFVQRRKRKGLHAYPRTLNLKEINKYLNNTEINYPKLLKNGFKYVNEEYIEATEDINNLSNLEIIEKTINVIVKLNKLEIKNKRIVWSNNSEFLRFNIENLKEVLISRKIAKIDTYLLTLDSLYNELDNNRKLCFIHGDIHRDNMIINKGDFYLIDWELATYGDLAYEIATHFILMKYNKKEKEIFMNQLANELDIDVEKLMNDVDVYINFETYRRKILKEIKRN